MKRRWPVTVAILAVIAVSFAAVACASKDEAGSATPTAAPASSTAAASQGPTASGSAGNPNAFVIYRDDQGNLVARNYQTGATYKQTVDYNEEVIVKPACTDDGARIGYLVQNFHEKFRRLQIRGTDAPSNYIQVSSNVQEFTWSPDGKKVATAEWDNQAKHSRIAVVDISSGESTEIYSGDKLVAGLDWSPDGSKLVFDQQDATQASSTVQIIDASGGTPKTLAAPTDVQWFDTVWTPDGKALVATGLAPEASQLYQLDPETGAATQLTHDLTIYRRDPQFSPDGSVIGFTGSIVALPQITANPLLRHSFGIFVLNPDGSGEKALTVDPRTSAGASVDPYLNAYLLGWCAPGAWLDDLWQPGEAAQ